MAPGGAHPRCALGWRRLGASSASTPRREPEQRCWWTCRPGTTSILAIGLSGHFRSRFRRPTCPSGKAVVPKDAGQTGSDRNPVRSLLFPPAQEPGHRLSGPPEGGRALPRGVVTPEGAEDLGPWPLRGATACVEWAGLLAPREEAPGGQPVVPLRPSLRASRARSGGVFRRAPAWHSPSHSKVGGGSPSRPVAAAPFSSVRHFTLA